MNSLFLSNNGGFLESTEVRGDNSINVTNGNGKQYLRVYIHTGSDMPTTTPETDIAGQSSRGRNGVCGGGQQVGKIMNGN